MTVKVSHLSSHGFKLDIGVNARDIMSALSILQIQSIPFIILNVYTRRVNTNIHAWTRGVSNDIESIKYLEAVRPLCVTYCCVT